MQILQVLGSYEKLLQTLFSVERESQISHLEITASIDERRTGIDAKVARLD